MTAPSPFSANATDSTHKVAPSATSSRMINYGGTFAQAIASWRNAATDSGKPRFRVIGPLGQGSQGLVVSAEDTDCRREVALKTLHRRTTNPEDQQRFIHEAQITAQLEHPGIVPVHDIGVLTDGSTFYAMKRIDGITLADLLEQEPAPQRTPARRVELIQVFSRVCDTMAFAHSRGVVHRDLKLRNIMVGRFGEVLVLDWGLAKVLGKSGSVEEEDDSHPMPVVTTDGDPNQTGPDCAVGTPATMSPEQALGKAVTVRCDVYSLGVVLYQILAGCSPYATQDSLSTIKMAATGNWKPLDQQPLAQRLPKRLIAIVHRAMALQPERRYPDAGALSEDLRRFLAGEAVEAWRETPVDAMLRTCARHRRGLAAVAGTLLVGAIGLGIWQIQAVRAERQQRIALHHKAADLELSGALDKARSAFERLLDRDPADRTAATGLERCKDGLRQRAEVEAMRQRQAEAESTRRKAEATARLDDPGEDPGRQRDFREALEMCQAALILDPANPAIPVLYQRIAGRQAALELKLIAQRVAADQVQRAAELRRKAEDLAAAGDLQAASGHLEAAITLTNAPEDIQRVKQLALLSQQRDQQQQQAKRMESARKHLANVRKALTDGHGQEAQIALEQARDIAPEMSELPALTEAVSGAIRQEKEVAARAVLASADADIAQADILRNRQEGEEHQVLALRADLAEQASDELRTRLALSEQDLAKTRNARAANLAQAAASLHQASSLAPWWPLVNNRLADFYARRLGEAEQAGDTAAAAAAEAQASIYDDGSRQQFLAGLVDVSVPPDTLPVILQPLVTGPMRTLIPQGNLVIIPPGSSTKIHHGLWLASNAIGVRTALRLTRGEATEIRLPSQGCADATVACIPGGQIFGSNGLPIATVATFHLARREVTVAEWLEFLNDPKILERCDQALADGTLILAPRLTYNATEPLWRRQGMLGISRFIPERQDGTAVNPALPVGGISGQDAAAYAAWRAARDGIPWRLPTPAEWTLAVQGGDGRPFPWGWAEDSSLAASAMGPKEAVPGGSFPWDQSVQGVFDLAGSVSEFATPEPGSSVQPLMGGNRFDRDVARLTAHQRRDLDLRIVHPGAGLRLAADAR